ncbi:autotransporter domain-containing protein [Pseudomonas sp. SK3(2021)]|nr:autotransporter domain-containing protein [Pseudomonas sp. SK3(2021)]
MEGLGGLTKSGSGELTLNGQNSYTGATLVQEGILKAGVAGAFVNNTAYAINGGTLDLNGFDLTVSKLEGKNGTIQLGNGSLTVDQGVNTHYDGAIEGLGGLTKSGSGGLILNGQNSYTGATLVREGHLVVGDRDHPNARLAGEVTVGQDAMLSGSGTLDRLIIDSGGTVAPGNSIGTLRTGDVTFNAGSVYSAEVGPNGRSDLIDSSGIATLNGGEIRVSLENRTNLLTEEEAKTLVGQTFNILTAQKGIVGQFSSVTPDYLFLNSQISVPPTLQLLSPVVPATPEQPVQPVPAVAIAPTPEPSPSITTTPAQPVQPVPEVAAMSIAVQRNQTSFASVAQTRNERAVATAADTLAPGNPVYESLLTFISAEQARQAFKQLDGQVHSDAAAAQITDSRYVREAVNARLQQTQALNPDAPIQADNSNGGWVQLLGGHTQLNSDHNATGYSSSTSGVLLGLDTDIGDGWRLGGATGYTKTEVKGSSKNSVDSDNFHLSAYGGKRFDTLALRFGAATTWHHFDTSRNLEYGNQSAHQKATYHARTDQVFGEVGYTAWSAFEPFANLTYINFQNDSFKERGKAAALHASKQSQDSIVSTVGLRGQMQLPVSSTRSVKLRGELGWEHQYGELDRESSLKFVGSEAAFAVNSVPASRDGAMVKASAEMAMTKDTQVSLNYTGLLSRQGGGNAVNLGFSFQF